MRQRIVWMICLLAIIMGGRVSISAEDKTEAIMENFRQDVLFVGNVSHISDDYVVLKVTDYIAAESTSETIAKREKNHRYVLTGKKKPVYNSSYYGKQTVEEGDHVVASLRKKNGAWQVANGIYQVNTDQFQTLSLTPLEKNMDLSKLKLKYFINSDGKMKDFSSDDKQNKMYYKNQKIYDARWNMKKYLTIEEIRNSEKLKAMDRKSKIGDQTWESAGSGIRRKLLFVADVLVIVGFVALLRKKHPKKKQK